MNLWDPEGTKFSVSAFAAGALNSFTFGVSNRVAGKLFGFDPSCADWGDGYGAGALAGDFNPRGILKRGIKFGIKIDKIVVTDGKLPPIPKQTGKPGHRDPREEKERVLREEEKRRHSDKTKGGRAIDAIGEALGEYIDDGS